MVVCCGFHFERSNVRNRLLLVCIVPVCPSSSTHNIATLRITKQVIVHVQANTELIPNDYASRPIHYIFVPHDFHKTHLLPPNKKSISNLTFAINMQHVHFEVGT